MCITRTYSTIREYTQLWLNEYFSYLDCNLILDRNDLFERFEFYGYEPDETGNMVFGYVDPPAWGTYFVPDERLDLVFIEDHAEAVAKLGFTLIYYDDYLIALGIDGAGYDFFEQHWIPLYKLRGLQWHDEDVSQAA